MKVLASTKHMSREDWLKMRRKGVGGSDAPVILGLSKYRTAFDLWADKRGLIEPDEAGEAADWGHILERPIAERYAKTTGLCVMAWPVMLQHDERKWQLANVDFFIVSPDTPDAVPGEVVDVETLDRTNIAAILEIKTTGIASRGSANLWENDGVPEAYEYQGIHYAAVTGVKHIVYAALVGGRGLTIRERVISPEQIESLTIAEDAFWLSVLENREPYLVGTKSEEATLKALYPVSYPKEIEANGFERDLVNEYLTLKAEADRLYAKMQNAKNQLINLAGDADTVTFEGQTLFTYKSTKTTEAVDLKALEAAHPDLVAQFKKEKAGFRVLRVKGDN